MSDAASTCWRQTVRQRLLVCAAVMGVWTCAIQARLVYLQVYAQEDLQARADRQRERTREVSAKRGDILDRNGNVLAYSVDVDSVYAVPNEIADAEDTAVQLCAALDDCTVADRRALAARLDGRRSFAWVERKVTPLEAEHVAALELDGVGFLKESQRFYPKKELAAQLLGFVGLDNVGLGGLEATYDTAIRGKEGTILVQADARHRAFSRVERPPTTGASIELTIDQYLQHIAERELHAGVVASRAIGGVALVMDPSTGEILALANEPTFNPHLFASTPGDLRRNRAVQDVYEPGSTFKVVTASAALEEGTVHLDDLIDASGGSIRFGRRVVRDTRDYGILSFTDAIVKSSNVAAIKVGLELGPDRLVRYLRRFGFGAKLSPDFPAETAGIVWGENELDDSALASVSMGYQIAVTPLQMATAVSSVANGGDLWEPRAVRAIVRNGQRQRVLHRRIRRTITANTAARLTRIMEQVVERGTGTRARVAGYRVAGKTGTAAKLIPDAHGTLRYSHTEYNASFVGFVPARRPALTIVVVIDSPASGQLYRGATHTGGAVAAPVFRRIAEASLRHLGVPRTLEPVPPVFVNRARLQPEVPTSGPVGPPSVLTLEAVDEMTTLPDLSGLSTRDVVRILTQIGMTARLSGTGVVVDQDPPAGTPIEPGAVCEIRLARRVAAGEAVAR